MRSGPIRTGRILSCAAAGLLLLGVARADVLRLTDGGQLEGTLEEVTFLAKGKKVTQARDNIKTIQLSGTGRLVLKLKKGGKVQGDLISLKFKSVGGLLTFQRENVVTVRITADPLAAVRNELAKKTATVKADDAEGLLKLAVWSSERGLKAEAVELARACLKAKPEPECAAKAHELLGHVLYKGEWMTPAEAMERKKKDGGDTGQNDDDPFKDKEPTVDALKEAMQTNQELYNTYCERVEDEKEKGLAAAKAKYGQPWADIEAKVKTLTAEITKREQLRDAERERHRKELRDAHRTKAEIEKLLKARFDDYNSEYNAKIRAVREQLLKAKLERTKLAGLIKPERAKVMRKAAQLKTRVRDAYLKNRRLLLGGKSLTKEQMTKLFDTTMEED